ncbi:MAG: DUF1080 domain-containing protein [Rhodothermaceae bacterium]|nr:DUF1080 domain-containing protein [Rhodothermaceae bacterium]
MRSSILVLLFFALSTLGLTPDPTPPPTDENGWVDLFNGKDLDNWIQRNGEAPYHIEGDMIVGTTIMDTPNSFLCTKENYGDFILEYDVIVDPLINSGVQIRSNSMESYRNGRVHGYQVELDPSSRAWTAGIYDEARRGWLYSLSRNKAAQKAFKQGTWNTIRVEAVGSSIRTWINGVMASNLVDDMTAEGFIALQVHSIGNEEMAGKKIMWRNIRIKTSDLDEERLKVDPNVPEFNYIPNTLTKNEKRKGWRLLWDGESTTGWRGAKLDGFPEAGWEIKDGILTVLASDGAESANGGDIVTMDTYSEFELELDFMIAEGANSGIKYFVLPELNKGPGSSIGLEYQILDDKKHPDAAQGVNGNRTLSSLYDLIPAGNLTIPGRNKRFNGIGSWNRARIVVKGNHIEHWLNNEKVLEYERNTPMYRALVAYSKYKVWPNFGEAPAGHILLQDHGDRVSFKSIKIREL